MRRFALVFLFAFIASGICGTAAAVEEVEQITGRLGAGANFSEGLPNENESDSGFYPGFNLTYGLMDYVAFQLDVGYTEFDQNANGADYGDLTVIPLICSLQWRYPFLVGSSNAAIYALGGVGVAFFDFDETVQVGQEIEADDSFAYRFGLGLEFFRTRNWSFYFESTYTVTSTTLELRTVTSPAVESTDTDFWLIGGGIKYYFN